MTDERRGPTIARRLRNTGRSSLFTVLWKAGFELRRIDAEGWAPENLAKPGLRPATLIDVGVGTGTAGLHEAFPDAHHVFVEPLPTFTADLERLVGRFGGEYHLSAAGATDGVATIHMDKRIPMQSSFSARTDDRERTLTDLEVPMTRLDTLRDRCGWSGPFGLKIDTEGHELAVVEGAPRLLAEAQFVIAELSLAERFADQSDFATFLSAMSDHGMRLCDILSAPKSHDREIIQIDAMFRRDQT